MAEANVPDRGGLLRGVGFLNLVVGGLLLLCGGGFLGYFGAFLVENSPFRIDPEMADLVAGEIRRQMLDDLIKAEQAATGLPAKEKIRQAREELQSKPVALASEIDFGRVNARLPWVSRYLWIDVVSALVLNALLVVSGAGLAVRGRWAPTFACWVAGAKILRLVGLTLFGMIVVAPSLRQALEPFATTEFGRAFLRRALDSSGGANPAAQLAPEDFVRIIGSVGNISFLMMLALGSVYPVTVLIVLAHARRGQRLAEAPATLPGSP